MKTQIQLTYDGNAIRFNSLRDELRFRDEILKTLRSYTNCRAKWILEHRHIPAAIYAIDLLRHFTGAYTNHGLLAVAKRCIALQNHLYALMPNPEGKLSHWCSKIETIVKISQAIVNDEKYYLSGQRYGQAAGFGQSPKTEFTSHSIQY